MNRKNIQKVRDHIAAIPRKRFNMALWGHDRATGLDVSPPKVLHDCGTCACIGGWTNAIFRTPAGDASARDSLGLDHEAAHELFRPSAVPFHEWEKITKPHAVRVLDHLLATGTVDWKTTRRAKKASA